MMQRQDISRYFVNQRGQTAIVTWQLPVFSAIIALYELGLRGNHAISYCHGSFSRLSQTA